jgi:tRNA modification GTPase
LHGAADTIFAVASGAGRAAVAVMRLSGPQAGAVLESLCRRRPAARVASLRTLRNGDGDVLDRALVLWLPAPGSYTGEDSAELHLHGGPAVEDGVVAALVAAGARPAEPGEFSRRAFLHGRMDLLQAEAVADLVAAESEAQRRQALQQLGGALGALYRGWTDRLTGLLAQQEALIDFPDEDLPPETEAAMLTEIAATRDEIARHLDDGRRGERVREGLVIAITGPPNVGKSTLINALAEREVAIVSPYAGTTRDVLEARVIIGGVPVTLLDTAGLRETADPVEAEGVRRAQARAASADLVVVLNDGSHQGPDALRREPRQMAVASKADLRMSTGQAGLSVSALTGEGMAALRARLAHEVRQLTGQSGPPALTRARHRAGLGAVVAALGAAADAPLPELRGEALRQAVLGIGRVTGRVGAEAILDAVFRQFCIGK